MKTFLFHNSSGTLQVEYVTDLIGNNIGKFTVMQIKGLEESEEAAGLGFSELVYDYPSFVAFAEANNLLLDIIDNSSNEPQEVVNSYIELAILTETLPDIELLGATESTAVLPPPPEDGGMQGDYFIVVTEGEEKVAFWLAIDGDNTEPTGANYLAADHKFKVDSYAALNETTLITCPDLVDIEEGDYFVIYGMGDTEEESLAIFLNIDGAGYPPTGELWEGATHQNAIEITTTGIAQEVSVVCPATAGAAQADYFVVCNQLGDSFGIWLDIDAAGTAPTGAAYVATTHKIEVDIVTGDTDAQVAGKVKTAVELDGNWDGFETITIDTATLSIICDSLGEAEAPTNHNSDDSGVGSFGVNTEIVGEEIDTNVSIAQKIADLLDDEGLTMIVDWNVDGYGAIGIISNGEYAATDAVSSNSDDSGLGSFVVETTQQGQEQVTAYDSMIAILEANPELFLLYGDYVPYGAPEEFKGLLYVPNDPAIMFIVSEYKEIADASAYNSDDSDVGSFVVSVDTSGYNPIPYEGVIEIEGGNGPFVFSVVDGTFPPALDLVVHTGQIVGVVDLEEAPYMEESYTFTILVEDAFGNSAEQELTINVAD